MTEIGAWLWPNLLAAVIAGVIIFILKRMCRISLRDAVLIYLLVWTVLYDGRIIRDFTADRSEGQQSDISAETGLQNVLQVTEPRQIQISSDHH